MVTSLVEAVPAFGVQVRQGRAVRPRNGSQKAAKIAKISKIAKHSGRPTKTDGPQELEEFLALAV